MTKAKPNPKIKAYVLRDNGIRQVERHDYQKEDRLQSQAPVLSIRTREPRPGRPWVPATGTHAARLAKARGYLRAIDYGSVIALNKPEDILANAIVNLRNYHRLEYEDVEALILNVFNRRSGFAWSTEAIRTAWELSEGITPSWGFSNERTASKRKTLELEDLVVDIVAHTRKGGRVSLASLFELFKLWNPDFETNVIAFGRAFSGATGLKSSPSKGVRYYSGLHLPSELETGEPDSVDQVGVQSVLPNAAA